MNTKKFLAVAAVMIMVLSGLVVVGSSSITEAKVLKDKGTVSLTAGSSADPDELGKLGLDENAWQDNGTKLVLSNVSYNTASAVALRITGDATNTPTFTIEVDGNNSLSSAGTGESIALDITDTETTKMTLVINGINGGKLTLTSNSSLTSRATFSTGLYLEGTVTVNECNLVAKGGKVVGDVTGSYGIYTGKGITLGSNAIVFAYGGDVLCNDTPTAKSIASSGVMVFDLTPIADATITLESTKGNEAYLYGYGGKITYRGDAKINVVSSGVFTTSGLSIKFGVLHGYGGDTICNVDAHVESVGIWCAYLIKTTSEDINYMVSEISGKGGKATSGGDAISAGIYMSYYDNVFTNSTITNAGFYGYGGYVYSSSTSEDAFVGSFGVLVKFNDSVQVENIQMTFKYSACEAVAGEPTRDSNTDAFYGGLIGYKVDSTGSYKSALSPSVLNSYFYVAGDSMAMYNRGSIRTSGGEVIFKAQHQDGHWEDLTHFPFKEEAQDCKKIVLSYQYVVFTTAYGDESPVFAEFVDKTTREYTFKPCDYLVPEGAHFEYWWANGERYDPGDTIILGEDQFYLQVTAVWAYNHEQGSTEAVTVAIVGAIAVCCLSAAVILVGIRH